MTEEREKSEELEVEADGPETAPDLLAKRGTSIPGMRRLNRVPLMLAAAIGSALVGVIGYTLIQRQQHPQGALHDGPGGPPQHASAQEILRDAPTTGVVKAAGPKFARAPDKGAPPADLVDVQPARFDQQGQGQDQPPRAQAVVIGGSRAPTAQDQERERERQDRLIALREARAVPTSVQLEKHKDTEAPRAAGQVDPEKIVADLAKARAAAQGTLAQPAAGGGGDANNQAGKQGFLSASTSDQQDHYLHASRTGVVSPFEVKQGAVIPAVLIGGINSDLPGQLIAQVTENVWDTRSGRYLLVPQGAKLIGTYDSNITVGQTRVLVAWTRIIFPDASSIDLGMMPGTDPGGYAGFHDKVNNHYLKVFGNALLLSVFSAGVQLSQPQPRPGDTYSAQQVVAGSMGQQLGQLGTEIARRNLSIQPTLEIRPGYRFNVMVTKDMVLEPWVEARMEGGVE